MAEERALMREVLGAETIQGQAERFRAVWPEFDEQSFLYPLLEGLGPLGVKERSDQIVEALEEVLPRDFQTALELVVAALPPKIEGEEIEGFGGFICWPLGQWIAKHGLEHFELSLNALYELTQSFSAEFSIRPFLSRYPEATLARLAQWALDPNPHVRRLVSEGTRPRLPWAPALPQYKADPRPLFGLLTALREDPVRYVRRSVANHLNDVSKDHPDLAVELLATWNREAPGEGVGWITGHALRSLIKAGHPGALELMGYTLDPQVEFSWTQVPRSVKLGDQLSFAFTLSSSASAPQRLVIDFAVDFLKAQGQQKAKVFKLSQKTLTPGQRIELSKSLRLVQRSTRKLYPGRHGLRILLSGQEVGRAEFELEG